MKAPRGDALAEVALDSVAFDDPRSVIRLYEVELEARSPAADVRALGDALIAAFPSLRSSPHGKLSTGLAAIQARSRGQLELTANGALTPAALRRLDRALSDRP